MLTVFRRPNGPRRGVTLVEMLVVVALVILMMVILVQIFQQATGAITASRQIQDLDMGLRQLDQRIKQDLIGATARFTPPLNPDDNLGYFEIGENAFADPQGEDIDDYMAFTTKAPEGQVFTGRCYIPGVLNANSVSSSGNQAVQPITITSQLAEVIYFVRNGNLYRRVFLIAPDRQSSISLLAPGGGVNSFPFQAISPSYLVSWLGVNDLSARPNPTNASGAAGYTPILLNTLGDLTNRENRAFRPRFRPDYFNNATGAATPDGINDDFNGDDVDDFYPTLYPNAFAAGLIHEVPDSTYRTTGLLMSTNTLTYDVMAFPYIFPGMFSQPETLAPYSLASGWIHSLDPSHSTYLIPNPTAGQPPIKNPYTGNQAPLIAGDNLATPSPIVANGMCQTWWGFPTWRETLSTNWQDPVFGPNLGGTPTQRLGLRPFPPSSVPTTNSTNFLPPVSLQFANDGAGSATFGTYVNAPGVWDDDLIATNVRSFDIKVYDPSAPLYGFNTGYLDLGYGLQSNAVLATGTPALLWDATNQPQGFGHSGRMPPAVADLRLNPARPSVNGGLNNNFVGDDGSTNANGTVIRLTRVWDTWSTDYSNGNSLDVYFNGYLNSGNNTPIFPSYPAPYTSPLRGIQITIRLNDPRGEYVKTLTIRQDFTDKL